MGREGCLILAIRDSEVTLVSRWQAAVKLFACHH